MMTTIGPMNIAIKKPLIKGAMSDRRRTGNLFSVLISYLHTG